MRFVEDLFKLPVYDEHDEKVGHLVDVAVVKKGDYPKVSAVAVQIYETDKIGAYELLEPVKNIVLVIPWDQIEKLDKFSLKLRTTPRHLKLYDFKQYDVFLDRDLLDNQIVDRDGYKIQRVDDLILEPKGKDLLLIGIYVGFGGMLDRLGLDSAAKHLLQKLGIPMHEHMLPWTAVAHYGQEHEQVKLNVGAREALKTEKKVEVPEK